MVKLTKVNEQYKKMVPFVFKNKDHIFVFFWGECMIRVVFLRPGKARPSWVQVSCWCVSQSVQRTPIASLPWPGPWLLSWWFNDCCWLPGGHVCGFL